MSETENRQMVKEAFEALNAHDLDRYVKQLAEPYVWEADISPTPIRGPEGTKQAIAVFLKAFPDLHFETDQIIISGDYTAVRWRATGTHKGEFNGIAPTNRQVNLRGCTVTEIKGGQVVKSASYSDRLALLEQLGAAAKAVRA